ncbi:MAG: putative toxin-antitoxin system toxin component, PIN family [Candidatus Solibacter usitatus]|nr:putative toxin-antitoxin system toxin component, PIN family [Candidatus Solibacter usitatus]
MPEPSTAVSAVLTRGGAEAYALDLVLARRAVMFVTAAILTEYEGVLRRPKLRLAPKVVDGLLNRIADVSVAVKPATHVKASPHEDDNRFLECAEASAAHYLVTGNRRHFPDSWKATRIVSARELVELLIDAERRA